MSEAQAAQVVEPAEPARLEPIVIGMGAVYGYSGNDLTNVHDSALAGEVPYLPLGSAAVANAVLELRIHGVGGAPPPDNLETPATLQVAGDATAGFFRPWHPGSREQPAEDVEPGDPPPPPSVRREAYCWGGLNTRAASRALWLMLVSFMVINVAHWALPAPRAGKSRLPDTCCRALLRLLALTTTVAFVGTAITVLVDLVAWQAPGRGALPSWLGLYGHLGIGPRVAIALLVVAALVGLLVVVSVQTVRSYESWAAGEGAQHTPGWPMTNPNLWRGERPVVRQRNCHVGAVGAEIIFFAALPHSSAGGIRVVAIWVAVGLAAAAVVLLASPWADHARAAGVHQKTADIVCTAFAIATMALAVAISVARFWWRPDGSTHALPGDQRMQTMVVFVELGVIVALVLLLLVQTPWKQRSVMGCGFASALLTVFACMVSTIFGAAFTLTIANILGTPKVTFSLTDSSIPAAQQLYLPSTIYAGGVGVIATIVAVAVFGLIAALRYFRLKSRLAVLDPAADSDSVLAAYSGGDPNRYAAKEVGESVRKVAGTWARSALTDLAATALAVIAVPTAVLVLAYQAWMVATGRPGAHWLQSLSSIGGTLGVLATGYFLVTLRQALLNASSRKRFGFLWDVGTFWPRACHPFAPPCYAERSIPEVVTRIRRIVGDVVRDTHADGTPARDPALALQRAERADSASSVSGPIEAHSAVLLTGYSQGTPIAVAVLAQLPPEVRRHVALLTLAAPVRRLYGRTFPAYYGGDQLGEAASLVTGANGSVRWRNLVRRSDYVGGWALRVPPPPGAPDADPHAVDVQILDPPVLWVDGNPSPPATHLHSDWFPDPQTRPYIEELAESVQPVSNSPSTV
jgi:hypothetical protein